MNRGQHPGQSERALAQTTHLQARDPVPEQVLPVLSRGVFVGHPGVISSFDHASRRLRPDEVAVVPPREPQVGVLEPVLRPASVRLRNVGFTDQSFLPLDLPVPCGLVVCLEAPDTQSQRRARLKLAMSAAAGRAHHLSFIWPYSSSYAGADQALLTSATEASVAFRPSGMALAPLVVVVGEHRWPRILRRISGGSWRAERWSCVKRCLVPPLSSLASLRDGAYLD